MTCFDTTIRLSLLAAFCVLSGCGDSAEKSGGGGATGSGKRTTSITRPDPAKVAPPKLSAQTPVPAERGKLDIYAPEGWNVPPGRSSKYLVQFRFGRVNTITVHKSEDYAALKDVTKEKQDKFVEQVQEALNKKLKNPDAITLEGIAPEGEESPDMNPFIGAHYVLRGKFEKPGKSLKRDQLFLVTVVGGRKYTIELRTDTDLLHKSRPAAHAVAAGMRFYDPPKVVSSGPKETTTFDDSTKEKPGFDDSGKPAP